VTESGDTLPRPRLHRWGLVGLALLTVPAGGISGGIFYSLWVAWMGLSPNRYYSYRSSLAEQFLTGLQYGGTWMGVTLPFTLIAFWGWQQIVFLLPVLERRQFFVFLGMLILALPSSYAALLSPMLVFGTDYRVDLLVWLVIGFALWLPRVLVARTSTEGTSGAPALGGKD
jgi:hypothetical protein